MNMKKTLAIALAVAGLATSGAAFAQNADQASATATGQVTIIRPLTIVNTSNQKLDFGRVVQPRTGNSTITLSNSTGAVSTTGTAVALPGTTTFAPFVATGEGGQAVTVTVPATFDLSGPGLPITVNLTPTVNGSTTLSGTLGSSGTKAIDVGGNFDLSSGQASGAYSGTFTVTVQYN